MAKPRKASRRLGVLATTLLSILILTMSSPAHAIINGLPDGNRHPNAGLVLFGDVSWCSGVLISPNYFATAAHCIDIVYEHNIKTSDVRVTFAEKPSASSTYYRAAEVKLDPKWYNSFKSGGVPHATNDYGLVKLQRSVNGITPANLPALGTIDTLPRDRAIFETVGYGATSFENNQPIYPRVRNYAVLALSAGNSTVTSDHMKLGDGKNGPCYGDSGGPTYIGANTGTVYGLTSFGTSYNCSAWMYAARLDIPDAHSFYRAFD